MDELHNKKSELISYLKQLERVAVAFSAGVDSTFLLSIAREALGNNVIAVTGRSVSFPEQPGRSLLPVPKRAVFRVSECG